MKVTCAKHAGACYGVNRAIKAAKNAVAQATDEHPVYTLGPLIHNPVVIEKLQAQGAVPINNPSEVESGTLILRTHGVTPDIIDDALKQGLQIIDATCPHVSKVQAAASELSKEGYFVFILGEEGHPEVEGIRARAGDKVLVLESAKDLPKLLPSKHIGVVVQTTQMQEKLLSLVSAIKQLDPEVDLQVRDTICNATRDRQIAAKALALDSDIMIVLGGKFSGNTKRLAQICQEICPRTYHIEKLEDLDKSWFSPSDRVGITAGASTPHEQVQELMDYISSLGA